MSRDPSVLPPVLLGAGVVSDPRPLARFGELAGIPLTVGPVEAGARRCRVGNPVVHRVGVGGVDHDDVRAVSPAAALEVLDWVSARGLTSCVAVRGTTSGDLVAAVEQVLADVEPHVVTAVEVDLRGVDAQTVHRWLTRVQDAVPADRLLMARLAAFDPALVTCGAAAVRAGAGAIVVSGQVPLAPGRWWSGPSTAALCLAGLRTLTDAADEDRWPGAPLVAAGGVHSPGSALDALAEGAVSVQLGTALWADPTILWRVRDAVTRARAARGDQSPYPDRTPYPHPSRRTT